MKELSTEEKARAYDDALEIAKDIINRLEKGENILLKADLKLMFPQLKESEDERIRKALCKLVHDIPGDRLWVDYDVHTADALAWLEKQVSPNIVADAYLRGCNDTEKKWLEKQGEQKPADWNSDDEQYLLVCKNALSKYQKSDKWDAGIISRWLENRLKSLRPKNQRLEKQGESKPFDYENANIQHKDFAPKVEPKFKVGDWITNGDYTWKIVEVKSLDYILQSQDGNIVDDTISYVDEHFHLWTIQDAKDGDVLVDSLGNVCIYQEPSTKLMYHSYCYGNHKCFIDMGGSHEIVGSYPATKEQRDLLFQKMKEAGSEWDAEKKELKKIEKQKPVEWSEEDDKMLQTLVLGVGGFILFCGIPSEDIVNWLKSLKQKFKEE